MTLKCAKQAVRYYVPGENVLTEVSLSDYIKLVREGSQEMEPVNLSNGASRQFRLIRAMHVTPIFTRNERLAALDEGKVVALVSPLYGVLVEFPRPIPVEIHIPVEHIGG